MACPIQPTQPLPHTLTNDRQCATWQRYHDGIHDPSPAIPINVGGGISPDANQQLQEAYDLQQRNGTGSGLDLICSSLWQREGYVPIQIAVRARI